MNKTAGVAEPTLRILQVKIGSRWLEDGMRKWEVIVSQAFSGNTKPISVAEWDTRLTHALPQELQSSLPTIEQIEAELARVPTHAETEQKKKTVKKSTPSLPRTRGRTK